MVGLPVARWRWLLVVVVIGGLLAFPPGGIDHSPAQSSSNGSTVIVTSGSPGGYDTSLRVGECRYTRPGGVWQTAIKIPAPSATVIAGKPNQRITWEPRVYQVVATGRQFVQSGPVQSADVVSGSKAFALTTLSGLPQGPLYFTGGRLTWFSDNVEVGAVEFFYALHDAYNEQDVRFSLRSPSCPAIAAAEMTLSTYRTTVNVKVRITGRYFPISAPVAVTWKGAPIAQVMSDANGNVAATIPAPATPLGDYRVGLNAGSSWQPFRTLTIVPRVKLIPGQAARGETVKISLRGFARKESVRVRWLRNGTWVEVGWVNTSNTGSGELWIPVPNWATDGQNSVRGDGPGARAQTNAVTVTGGPGVTLAEEPATPTPDIAVPATPEPIVDGSSATPAPLEESPPEETPAPIDTPAEPTPESTTPTESP